MYALGFVHTISITIRALRAGLEAITRVSLKSRRKRHHDVDEGDIAGKMMRGTVFRRTYHSHAIRNDIVPVLFSSSSLVRGAVSANLT
jgi:hypothetical protein